VFDWENVLRVADYTRWSQGVGERLWDLRQSLIITCFQDVTEPFFLWQMSQQLSLPFYTNHAALYCKWISVFLTNKSHLIGSEFSISWSAVVSCHVVHLQEQKRKGVIAASAGNHALALAYHGNNLRIPVTVVMPQIAPIMKVQMCKHYGANIIMHGADISEVQSSIRGVAFVQWKQKVFKLYNCL